MSIQTPSLADKRQWFLEHDDLEKRFKTEVITFGDAHLFDDDGRVGVRDLFPAETVEHACFDMKRVLSAQSYGKQMEKALIRSFNLAAVTSRQGVGDADSPIGHMEIKVSIAKNGQFSIQQVRIARDIPHYMLLLYDLPSGYLFLGVVPKAVMVSLIGSQSHGTKASSAANADPEYCLQSTTIRNGKMSPALKVLEDYNFFSRTV